MSCVTARSSDPSDGRRPRCGPPVETAPRWRTRGAPSGTSRLAGHRSARASLRRPPQERRCCGGSSTASATGRGRGEQERVRRQLSRATGHHRRQVDAERRAGGPHRPVTAAVLGRGQRQSLIRLDHLAVDQDATTNGIDAVGREGGVSPHRSPEWATSRISSWRHHTPDCVRGPLSEGVTCAPVGIAGLIDVPPGLLDNIGYLRSVPTDPPQHVAAREEKPSSRPAATIAERHRRRCSPTEAVGAASRTRSATGGGPSR